MSDREIRIGERSDREGDTFTYCSALGHRDEPLVFQWFNNSHRAALSPDDARAMARMLIEAADAADALTKKAP